MITLTKGATTLELPVDLYWLDEYAFQPVQQTADRSVTGALLLQYGTKIAGRPITLQPIDENSAWMPRTLLETLNNWASTAGTQLSLSIGSTTYTVVFRHIDGAVEASPIVHFNDRDNEDWYLVTLRFMEI